MNEDILSGKWKQVRGKAKEWWGKLTDDDLDKIQGKRDLLVGKIQERYGHTKDKAEQEVDRRMREFREAEKGTATSSREMSE